MEKILCIGEALIDMICTDKGTALSDVQHFLKKPGGAPANVAAAIAALGAKAELLARVGTDPFGKYLINVLEDTGVSTRWILQDNEHFTTLAFVSLMENGEKDFYFNRGADAHLSIDDMTPIQLDEYAIIHFGSATAFLPGPLQATYTHLLAAARARGIFVSFDPNYRPLLFRNDNQAFIEQSWYFLANCDFFKMSDEEALLLTGTANLEEAVSVLFQKTSAVFAITLGREGTLLGLDGISAVVGSIEVRQIDSTGAGDAFVGAVLCQLNEKKEKKVALTRDEWTGIIYNGNKAGARTCEYLGAMEAFRHLSRDIFK